jgi:PAS domain S-box-containing protein
MTSSRGCRRKPGSESAAIMLFLMQLREPESNVAAAVPAAMFIASALRNFLPGTPVCVKAARPLQMARYLRCTGLKSNDSFFLHHVKKNSEINPGAPGMPPGEELAALHQRIAELETAEQQHQQMEKSLGENERKYRLLFENMTAGAALHEMIYNDRGLPIDFRYLEVNSAFEKLTGVPASEVLGKTGKEVNPILEQEMIEAFGKVARTGKPITWEGFSDVRGRFYDAWIFSPAKDRFAAVFTDITERRLAEEALRHSEERYRQLFDLESDAIVVADCETGKILEVNAAAVVRYGYSRDEWLRMKHTDVSAGPEKVRNEEDMYVPLHWHRKKDGVVFPVEISSSFYERQGRKVQVAAIRDITARKQIEERILKLSSLKQRLLGTGNINEKLKLITDGMVRIFGADFARIWLTQEADLCEKGCWHAAITEGPNVCRNRTQCLHLFVSSGRYPAIDGSHRRVPLGCYKIGRIASGENAKFITNSVKNDPQIYDREWAKSLGLVAFAGFRLLSAEGKPIGVMALFRKWAIPPDEEAFLADLANAASQVVLAATAEEERRKLERQVQQVQKLESIGVLAGGIAHDFNNLLTAILGHANLAAMDLPSESPLRDNLREIDKATRRAAELCRQMLAYSGRGKFIVEPINLSHLAQELANLLQISISKKVTLLCHFATELPAIEADAAQVRQVVMNLVINASEAIGDKKGVITVSTGVMHCDEAYLRGSHLAEPACPGDYVYFEAIDTGCGMDAETRAKIFDPFFTTKFAGRGLGLAAVLGIVRSHKGAIKINSEPGKGTTFRVLFPASSKTAKKNEPPLAAELWRGTGTILVVDDEESVRKVAEKMLALCGFRVLAAANGREAIALFQESHEQIACVLLDLTMPQMDGEETFRELRRIRGDLRVILASGYSETEVSRRFAGQNVAGFIEKPYELAMLNVKLREALTGVADVPG